MPELSRARGTAGSALTPAEELARLHGSVGADDDDPPGELDSFEAPCPAGGEAALARVREVLEVVLERSQGEWPGLEDWKAVLPAWFLAACVDDAEVRDCVIDRWSIRAWIYWFQPDLRKWRWWSAEPRQAALGVTILVLERPYLRGALEWLVSVAGRE